MSNYVKKLIILFQSEYTILHSYQQYLGIGAPAFHKIIKSWYFNFYCTYLINI